MRNVRPCLWWSWFVAAALVVAPGVGAENLLQNGSFNAGIGGWTATDSSVTAAFDPEGGSTLPGGSGPGSLRLQATTSTLQWVGVEQAIAIPEVGTRVELVFSYWAPEAGNAATGAGPGVSWRRADGNEVSWVDLLQTELDYDRWVRRSGQFVVPAGAVSGMVYLLVGTPTAAGGGDSAIVAFDDVVVAAEGSPTAVTLFLPAAASAPGAQGTHWTTEVWAHNLTDESVSLAGAYLPPGGDNTAAVADLEPLGSLPPAGFLRVEDVVAQVDQQGSGALVLEASVETSTAGDRLVVATSRTSTPNQAGPGSYGQAIPAVPSGERAAVAAAGVRVSSAYRTNVGALNTSAGSINLLVELLNQQGSVVASRTWNLAPYEPRLVSAASLGVTFLDGGTARFTLGSSGSFRAFLSVVDNSTGDAVYVAAE